MKHSAILTFFTLTITISHLVFAQELGNQHQLLMSSNSSSLDASDSASDSGNDLNDRIQFWSQRVERTRRVRNISAIVMASGVGIAAISAVVLALNKPDEDLHLDDSMYFFVGSFYTGCGVVAISAVPFIAALIRHKRSKRQLDEYLKEKADRTAFAFIGISVLRNQEDHLGLAVNFIF